ncbi:helix-turn-helix transcriptional regulator [Megamonas funiformis]|nr:helix-turn-helix transcriptional regulator [Megamonas funiformis]
MDAKVIGQRLLQLRNNLNKTRKDVAEACGISVSALTMYEIGERIPRDEIKIRLSNYYKKSITSIFFK